MKKPMSVSVIIVTIGAKDYVLSCLDSLAQQTLQPDEIILMDNSLDPELPRLVSRAYPAIKIHTCGENLYYGAALNKGIGQSGGEFILCLNDDVTLDKDFIRQALRGFSLDQRIGAVSGKIMRRGGRILDSTGLLLTLYRSAGERGYGRVDRGGFEKPGFIFGASGCAAFYRRKMLEAIKEEGAYFDPGFAMFYEDLDVAWRAKRSGWRAFYIPQALAYHVRGGSFRPDSGINKFCARKYLNPGLHCQLILNRYRTIRKNETFFGFLLHLLPILLYDACAWLYLLLFRPGTLRVCLKQAFAKNTGKKSF